MSMGWMWWWHKSPATEKPLVESCGKVPICPGLVALAVVVPMVALPSPLLPWWDHLDGMLSSEPWDP